MIQKTDRYRSIISSPWIPRGQIFHKTYLQNEVFLVPNKSPEDYPDMFQVLYELEDGTEVCFGDNVWREKNGVVRSVIFGQVHVDKNSKVFGTSEACEKWLKENADNIRAELTKQCADSSFMTLKAHAKRLENEVAVPENISIKNIIKISEGITKSLENIELQYSDI